MAVGVALLVLNSYDQYSTRLIFPFFKTWIPDIGLFYVPFAALVLVGATHSVNLTDGLDGLAISVFGIAAAAYTALAYVSTHREFANYLQLVRLDSAAAELAIFCGALVGASLGFLWWNSYPAEIFMGDVGSLALGGALGTVALLIKQEFLLVIVGGVFVLEAAVRDHPGRLVQDHRPARVQDGADAPSLRIERMERAEGDLAVPDRRDRVRALQPDDVEAAMKSTPAFSVTGKRVVVVGAARSGVAAAQLLVRRGATVTLSDVREQTRSGERDRGNRRDAGARRPYAGHVQQRRSDRAQPRVCQRTNR